jgi:hypothetical protein
VRVPANRPGRLGVLLFETAGHGTKPTETELLREARETRSPAQVEKLL